MGQIRKINDVYYIEFYARGLLYSQIGGDSLEKAQKLLSQVEEKIAGGEALTIVRHIELVDFFERFITEAKEQPYPSKSIKRFSSTIQHFSTFLNSDFPQVHQLAELTPVVIESYKDHLVKIQNVKIVNLTILLIREILEFGIKLGFLNDNPSLHVRLLPWPHTFKCKPTARYNIAKQFLPKGVGLGKLSQLLKLPDIARVLYYAKLIPLSRENEYL